MVFQFVFLLTMFVILLEVWINSITPHNKESTCQKISLARKTFSTENMKYIKNLPSDIHVLYFSAILESRL